MSDLFSQDNEVKPNFQKWTKVGDAVKGVLVEKVVRDNQLKPGTKQTIYTLVQDDGSTVYVGGRQGSPVAVIGGLESCKLGQEVGVRYEGDKPSIKPGMNASKIIKVYTIGTMKPEVLADFKGDPLGMDEAALPPM